MLFFALSEIHKKYIIQLICLLGCLPSLFRLNSHLGFPDNNARYEHLARNAPAILDDSLSADSYLSVLYIPSKCPRTERFRFSLEALNDTFSNSTYFEDGPKSNLDSVRYLECINYFQDVSFKFYLRQAHFGITLFGFYFKILYSIYISISIWKASISICCIGVLLVAI